MERSDSALAVYDLPAARDHDLGELIRVMTPAESRLFEELGPAPAGVEPDYHGDACYEWLRGPYSNLAYRFLVFAHEGQYYLTERGVSAQARWRAEVAEPFRAMLSAADRIADDLIAAGEDEAYLAMLADYKHEDHIDRDRSDRNYYTELGPAAAEDPFRRRCAEQGLVQLACLRDHPAIRADNSREAMVKVRYLPTPFGQKVRRAILVRRQIRGDQGGVRDAVGDVL